MLMLNSDICAPNFFGEPITLTSAKFFFIFCPNNSGTTVLSQYLAGQLDAYLPTFGNNEGQAAPEVKKQMRTRPWDESNKFDWKSIRNYWENLAGERTFVEASPPNLMRVDDIKLVFGKDSSAITSICNPYQHVSSSIRRYAHEPRARTKAWIRKARKIMQIQQAYPFFPAISYEEFVANPQTVNERLGVPFKEVEISGKKGSNISGIHSGYHRAIGFLKPEDVITISTVLEEAPEVMEYFGYALCGPEILETSQASAPEEFGIGLQNREKSDRHIATDSHKGRYKKKRSASE